MSEETVPSKAEAQAELDRRQQNRKRKEAGEPKLPGISNELTQAKAHELKEWAGISE